MRFKMTIKFKKIAYRLKSYRIFNEKLHNIYFMRISQYKYANFESKYKPSERVLVEL